MTYPETPQSPAPEAGHAAPAATATATAVPAPEPTSVTSPAAAHPAPSLPPLGGSTGAAAATASGPAATGMVDPRRLHLLREVELGISVELGRSRMTVREVLGLTPGAVVELDRPAGSPVDVLVNGTLMARGEVVVVDDEYAVRITEVVSADPAVGLGA